MFYYICGQLTYTDGTVAVLDVGGVGYKMTVTGNTYQAVAPLVGSDKKVKLYTHMAVREDDIELFGFYTEAEKKSFCQLLNVSGIGPKAALSILSLLTPEKLALAICTDDSKTIARANGIGPKTAARVILELKDKMMKEDGLSTLDGAGLGTNPIVNVETRGKLGEAVDALVVLGYTRAEAMTALRDAEVDRLSIEELIRFALKKMMKY